MRYTMNKECDRYGKFICSICENGFNAKRKCRGDFVAAGHQLLQRGSDVLPPNRPASRPAIPFAAADNQPVAIGGMSRTELDREIKKGMDSLEAGPLYSADDVDQELARDFGI